ncbi:LLM class flavin-dependent oxidoreductase [Nakamurella endophytica]|uniref:Oxidoreductase n=1 Tax=Nakamurella endophytica TaxID=1748367 RepID=A0A917TBE3_9ACTN|nr:LLM class flavin-dependent oxidoreductase [Nakamurella endophytica]GGM14423.1 oxidoreductase [Nakamurella endophytica]
MPTVAAILPPTLSPEDLLAAAEAAEQAGLAEVWLWEDCFKESGIAPAAAILARTQRLVVGIGLLPVPLRNVALTAMELATLARMFPGRLLPGIGHGVLDWMAQVGARAASPVTLLREYASALRDLLHGATVTVQGRYVQLSEVALDWPPTPAPPLLVGAIRERTMQVAAELGDGVILTGGTPPEQVAEAARLHREGRAAAGREGDADVVVFVDVPGGTDAAGIAALVRQHAAAGATRVALMPGDDSPVDGFVATLGREVLPLLG